jgi:4-hydroxy-2-oxoheptanedioate aldolase
MNTATDTAGSVTSPLNRGRLRSRLAAGEPTVGTFVGAAGVMLPRLDTAAEVATALRHLRYPPEGDRGVATYNRACRFGLDPAALDRANNEVLAVVQIESARAVEQVEEIAALDGVDVVFVGPRDLSHDLGVPGEMGAPSYLDALAQVRSAAQRFGKSCGLLVPNGAAAAEKRAQGWTFVAVGSELLATALTAEVANARKGDQS